MVIRNLVYLTYLVIISFVILEVIFRFLPTSSSVNLQTTTNENDILRYEPNQNSVASLGKNFYRIVKKNTNNYGFYSTYDYFANSSPNIVIIGDSYVQAATIKNENTIGEIIQSKNSDLKIYQLGVSGVPLSQYIQMIKYAKREFSPSYYAIIVVGNDFDESLCSYRIKEGTWCFDENFELKFYPFYGYEGLRNIARKSAFIRYLVFHLGLDWRGLLKKFNLNDEGINAVPQYAGNTERYKSKEIYNNSKEVIEIFFHEIIKMNLADKMVIILDADRRDIYKNISRKSYFNDMRTYMISLAVKNNIKYIDMEKVFLKDFKKYEKKFEFPTDSHWNERAHFLVAKELIKKYKILSD